MNPPLDTLAPSRPDFFQPSALAHEPLRRAITAATRTAEPQAAAAVLAGARLPAELQRRSQALAARIAQTLRTARLLAARRRATAAAPVDAELTR